MKTDKHKKYKNTWQVYESAKSVSYISFLYIFKQKKTTQSIHTEERVD